MRLVDGDAHGLNLRKFLQHRVGDRAAGGLDQPEIARR